MWFECMALKFVIKMDHINNSRFFLSLFSNNFNHLFRQLTITNDTNIVLLCGYPGFV